jgi:hypothetical protein
MEVLRRFQGGWSVVARFKDEYFRVIVSGGRDWRDVATIRERLKQLPTNTVLVHGACPFGGADRIADDLSWALFQRPAERHPPAVKPRHPGFAGECKKRNQEMVDRGADLVLAFPTPASRGTWDLVNRAKRAGIPVEVIKQWSKGERHG